MPSLNSNWYAFTKYPNSNAMKHNLVRPQQVLHYTVKINCSYFTRSYFFLSSLYSFKNDVEQSTSYLENFDSKSAAHVAGSELGVVMKIDLCTGCRNSDLTKARKEQLSSLLLSTPLSNYPFKQLQNPSHACLKPSVMSPVFTGRCGARDDAGEKILV